MSGHSKRHFGAALARLSFIGLTIAVTYYWTPFGSKAAMGSSLTVIGTTIIAFHGGIFRKPSPATQIFLPLVFAIHATAGLPSFLVKIVSPDILRSDEICASGRTVYAVNTVVVLYFALCALICLCTSLSFFVFRKKLSNQMKIDGSNTKRILTGSFESRIIFFGFFLAFPVCFFVSVLYINEIICGFNPNGAQNYYLLSFPGMLFIYTIFAVAAAIAINPKLHAWFYDQDQSPTTHLGSQDQ